MSEAFIVLGDRTDHGGTVIGGAPSTDTHGKRIARVGDMVACPRCKGVFPIAQGDPSMIIDGAAAAYHGCKVACGATLLSGQSVTTTEPSGGAGSGAGGVVDAAKAALGVGTVGAGLIAGYEDEPAGEQGQRFKGRFQVLDRLNGEPVVGRNVRLRSTGGQYLTGTTDGEGYTQWVERDATEALAFDLVDQGQA